MASEDAELNAMSAVRDALSPLDEPTRARVLRWAAERFGISAARPMAAPRPNEPEVASAQGRDLAAHFHSVSPRTDAEKVLAVAYWLQQTEGKDLESFRVNSELKELGFRVGNVTRAFDNLMATKPQLVMQTRKSGTSRQARKKFRVTDQGIRTIERMIQGQPSEIESETT